MATLETIRRRAGILVMAVIGLAMLGFVLGDFNISPSTKLAEINGKSFGREDYISEQQTLLNFYKMNYGQNLDAAIEQQVEDETWRRMVRDAVMEDAYNHLGIKVTTDELKVMVAGDGSGSMGGVTNSAFNEPHPIVRQMFSNPETGEFNRFFMTNYFNSLDQEQYAQEKERWLFIENEIVDERLNQKYLNLISKGLRPSSYEVRDNYLENGKAVDFSFVAKNYADIPDEEISISEADLKAYFKEHKELYRTQESRSMQYVVFEVVPSENDDANAKLWTEQTKSEFQRTETDRLATYVNSVSDAPFDQKYYNLSELSSVVKDSVLPLESGTVFGPYFEENAYKLSRLKDQQMRPDSVRVRHILIGYSVVGSVQRAEEISDSLVTVIRNGGDFNAIAREYSADESNRNIGGDLGWFGEGVMEGNFNDACFENSTGDLVTAKTRFGEHIIRIESQSRPVKKYQVATVIHNVYASNETDQDYYNRAVKFRGKATNIEKFEEQAREYGLDPRIVPDIARDQRTIPGMENPANIIGWVYNGDQGDVSTIFENDDRYIVAALTEVNEDGYADFESVRNEVELAVTKEKKGEKIAEQLKAEMESSSDISSLASAAGLETGEASRVQFANTFVSGVGLEPLIVGAALNLPPETMAGPYMGESSVFVLKVTNLDEADQEGDMSESENRLNFSLQSRSTFEAYNALLENAHIKDNRLSLFYGR